MPVDDGELLDMVSNTCMACGKKEFKLINDSTTTKIYCDKCATSIFPFYKRIGLDNEKIQN